MINPKSSFPVFVVANPAKAVEFYKELGFVEVFNSGWYAHLATDSGVQVGFLEPNHPTQPDFLHSPFSGVGSLLSLEVENAEESYSEAKRLNLEIALELKTEEWGQRHFILRDPHGLLVDILEATEPSEEYSKDYVATDTNQ